jgi:hypothetical protein
MGINKKLSREATFLPWSNNSLPFNVPEFTKLSNITEMGESFEHIPGSIMSRHWLFIGETGSGKTESGIKPLSRAILRYRGEKSEDMTCSVLMVDPKHELLEIAHRELEGSDRLVELGRAGLVVDFFEDSRQLENVSIKAILDQVFDNFSPGARSVDSSDNKYWNARGKEAMYAVSALAIHLERKGTSLLALMADPKTWCATLSAERLEKIELLAAAIRVANAKIETIDRKDAFAGELKTILKSVSQRIHHAPLAETETSSDWQDEVISEMKNLGLMPELLDEVRNNDESCNWLTYCLQKSNDSINNDEFKEFRSSIEPLSQYSGNWFLQISAFFSAVIHCNSMSKNRRTGTYTAVAKILREHNLHQLSHSFSWMAASDENSIFWICDIADTLLGPLKNAELNERIWLNPVTAPQKSISVRDCVESGKVMLYQPALIPTHEDDILGRAFKRLFFRATFTRKNLRRGVAYICDEFQRFVTGDEETGEQSFLDRCRAYRTICVFASQSVASIRYALLTQNPLLSQSALESSLAVILANIGNKFFFRNTDGETHNIVEKIIPMSTVFPHHIMQLRPLSTLRPGECYTFLATGDWSRQQIPLYGA